MRSHKRSAPQNKTALLRFIGMINYLSPYCPNLSATMQPLGMLTRDSVPFNRSKTQDETFKKSKQIIANSPALMYYYQSKHVALQVDASDNGLGGALLQPNEHSKLQSMATTSCSLKETEQRYSQIEKKYFAVWNSFHKFDQWLYGKSDIEVNADHKSLKTKMMKPLNKAPSRLLMRLQPYRFSTTQRKGTSPHLADTISRAPLQTPVGVKVTKFEVFRS